LYKNKLIVLSVSMFTSLLTTMLLITNIIKQTSLNLLNEKALKDDFNVDILVFQKLIKKKEVKPINSQPKNKTIVFPEETKINILITKEFIITINLSTFGS